MRQSSRRHPSRSIDTPHPSIWRPPRYTDRRVLNTKGTNGKHVRPEPVEGQFNNNTDSSETVFYLLGNPHADHHRPGNNLPPSRHRGLHARHNPLAQRHLHRIPARGPGTRLPRQPHRGPALPGRQGMGEPRQHPYPRARPRQLVLSRPQDIDRARRRHDNDIVPLREERSALRPQHRGPRPLRARPAPV